MENREDTIKECYKLFKLDERASKTEVELAFEVLTSSKNLPTEEYKHYRLAFEYLMHEVYTETEDYETEEVEEQKFDSTIRYIPEKVKTSIDSWEKFNEEELSSKVKTLFATQTVNLPMFFNSIISNSKNIFGKFFWTSNDMHKIIEETCLNPIVYNDITFELTYNYHVFSEQLWDIRSFVNNLKKIHCKDKHLCKKFVTHDTQYGIMAHCIVEHSLAESMINMLKTKARQVECSLNLTASSDGY